MTEKEKDLTLLYALKLLSMRMHTEKELQRKMYAKSFPSVEIRKTLELLKEKKLLDDSAFAKAYTEQLRNKANGDIRIRFQLKKRGLSEKTISEGFQKEGPEDQRKRALEIAELKLKPGKQSDPKERKRLYDYLVRKGFDYQVCRDVIGRIIKIKDDAAWDS